METKPYSLQSPEQIAKDYGGNKQRIAEAMQMGIIDPTAGTMAGMFIDRMRMAQQQEMAPQQTVAQQVFAPPAPPMGAMPPAGLGATPQAAAMPPMPGGAPMMAPMGAPGMAAGGLTTLPLPDDMFNEPDVGGYAAGGIVAFHAGGGADDEEGITTPAPGYPSLDTVAAGREDEELPPVRIPKLDFDRPSEIYGFSDTLGGNVDLLNAQAQYNTEEAQAYADYLRRQLSPEERQQRRQQDMWSMLGQIGARMASTPGSLLQAIGAGLGEAVPATAAAARERRAEERELRQSLLGEERTINRERMDRVGVGLDMLRQYGSLAMALNDTDFQNWWRTQDRVVQERIAAADRAAGIRTTGMQVAAQTRGDLIRLQSDREAREQERKLAARRAWADASGPGGTLYAQLMGMTADEREAARRNYISSFDTDDVMQFDNQGNRIR